MGREIKRVPADFSWPLNEPYKGFVNPFYKFQKKCPFCEGSGYNPETDKLAKTWYSEHWNHDITQDEVEVLIKHDRLMDFTHTWTPETGWKEKNPPYLPTAAEVNEWSRHGFGHDSLNHHICVETRGKRLGVYGLCESCKGDGNIWLSPEYQEKADKWERTEPPEGDWWQVWETVSEGSPISPPFATPEELARHMATTRWGADQGTSYEQWLKFIKGPGWAPSMVISGGVIRSGVEAVGDNEAT